MILKIQGALLFDVVLRADTKVIRCKACGAEVVLTGAAHALILHGSRCRVLQMVHEVERLKPFHTHIREAGKVKTHIHHEARERLA